MLNIEPNAWAALGVGLLLGLKHATDADHVVAISTIAKDQGADFVKTSTGFSAGGATTDDIRLIRKTVGKEMGIKASGGIRTLLDIESMVEAGANRIGTSNGVQIFS